MTENVNINSFVCQKLNIITFAQYAETIAYNIQQFSNHFLLLFDKYRHMAISSFSFINIGSILLFQHNTTHNDDSSRRLLYILKIIFKLICEKATTALNMALAFCFK